MAPEFIWLGGRIAVGHMGWEDLVAALLVGLILAFFIEPALHLVRHDWMTRGGSHAAHGEDADTPHLLFSAATGLAFALVSFCLHDALTTYLMAKDETEAARHLALINGLTIAISWAAVPFCITLAWVTAERRPWSWITIGLAILSPALTAWVFSWAWEDWCTTQLPALAILAAGYRLIPRKPGGALFRRAAWSMTWIAPLWLIGALSLDHIMDFSGIGWTDLYSRSEAWIDLRFYIGWIIGLMLAPVPLVPVGKRRPLN